MTGVTVHMESYEDRTPRPCTWSRRRTTRGLQGVQAYSTDNDPGPGDATQVAAHSAGRLATLPCPLWSPQQLELQWPAPSLEM